MSFLSTKKGKLCIWAVILLIIAGLVIYAWNTPPTKVSNLLLKRIEWDYMQFLRQQYDWNVSVDGKCPIQYCYGIFRGCVPVMFSHNTIQVSKDIVIDGVVFHYLNGNTIEVWYNSRFYSLEEAYNKNLLSREDLCHIANIHNNVRYSTSVN